MRQNWLVIKDKMDITNYRFSKCFFGFSVNAIPEADPVAWGRYGRRGRYGRNRGYRRYGGYRRYRGYGRYNRYRPRYRRRYRGYRGYRG